MKIEKLSDNQIRCTLTRADLAIRELKLSELAYGTDKAKSLFQDMMKQAAKDFGFVTEDSPLMIEAIPSASGSIVLIITKVEDPEELDTRFSKFSSHNEEDNKANSLLEKLEGAEDFLNLLDAITDVPHTASNNESIPDSTSQEQDDSPRVRLFSFANIDSVMHAANLLDNIYNGANTLYKDTLCETYILALAQTDHTPREFNRICNMLSEYGSSEKSSGVTLAYLEEHCSTVIASEAIQQLNTI